MNYISSFYKCLFYKNISPQELIKARSKVFFIDEALKINKLAYAFFLDNFEPANKAEEAAIDSLNKLEWFAGSLTAEQFAVSLQEFLGSPLSASLSLEFIHRIQAFIQTLQKSETQGYLIDLIRSRDLKLVYLILTGNAVQAKVHIDPEEIRSLSQYTLNELRKLQNGERRIYLLGDLMHDTRISIEKKDAEWEICYFDSAQSEIKVYGIEGQNLLLDLQFWDKVYSIKFRESEHDELENYFDGHFEKKDGPVDAVRAQEKNTCHFRGLLCALKQQCLSDYHEDPEVGINEWRHFKFFFGEYLLRNPKINSKITMLASKKQMRRSHRTELSRMFLKAVAHNEWMLTVDAFITAFAILGFTLPTVTAVKNPMRSLEGFYELFLMKLEENFIHLDLIESQLKALKNPSLNSCLEAFKSNIQIEQFKSERALLEAMKMSISNRYAWIDDIRNRLCASGLEQKHGYEKDVLLKTFKAYTPLDNKKVLEWLDAASKDPKILTGLEQKPIFVCVLIQGIYIDRLSEVMELYKMLHENDKKVLWKGLDVVSCNDYFSTKAFSRFLAPKYAHVSEVKKMFLSL